MEDSEARAINELSRRMAEKDKESKSKKGRVSHSNNNYYTEEEKLKLFPDLRMQSRMKYMDKR